MTLTSDPRQLYSEKAGDYERFVRSVGYPKDFARTSPARICCVRVCALSMQAVAAEFSVSPSGKRLYAVASLPEP